MEALFYIAPLLIIALVVFGAIVVIRRSRQVGSAWSSGLTAEARCLRTYTTTSGGGDTMVSTTLHHVYEFTTREGRTVRFEERNGPGTTLEGDIVTVHYAAEHPERATAHAPARGKLAAETGCVLVFFGVIVAFCVVFMVVAHEMFDFMGF
ncbi:DUF3592 domain-containing protein [Streptomyces sp. W16]|uniref:DUF3592 domain-containing protein n=1 Tax=Streptomyces sp. W16 TaxID=3076631 RepID=UPI00295AC782|nr:DUF3592 domain-containing protein [Streptomyces sp. W16]MDV9171528.1 DUF3592 domain-containing protein [Streptomyces sp. W16]